MQVGILSPHRDDAAFSCGLVLHHLLRAGSSLTIVNICTVSEYAPYITPGSGDRALRITLLRRKEDESFAEKLCVTAGAETDPVGFVDVGWKDVPVRWCMEDEGALAATGLPPEEVEKLRRAFSDLPPFDLVFVPMALGGHIDHRLVLEAARGALPAASLVFYEDLPYACRLSSPAHQSVEFASDIPLCEVWMPEQGAPAGLKSEYARCYPSQIASDVAEEMNAYASAHGGRERFLACAAAVRTLETALRERSLCELGLER